MRAFIFSVFLILFNPAARAQVEKISAEQLDKWDFYGLGTKVVDSHDIFLMKEDPTQSKGVIVISPRPYSKNVVMRFEAMSLTPATVLVAVLSLSDHGGAGEITIAEGYDGTNGKWGAGASDCYFVVYKSEAHNHFPFLRKRSFPKKTKGWNVQYEHHRNIMKHGVFHSVEVGRTNTTIWLKIDGKKIFKYKDPTPFGSGHLALRIRGTAGEYAACFIKDLEIAEDQ